MAVLAATSLTLGCSDDDAADSTTTTSAATDPAADLAAELGLDQEEAGTVLDDFCAAATSADPTLPAQHVRSMALTTAAEAGDVLLAITTHAKMRCPDQRANLAVVADDVYSAVTSDLESPPDGQLQTVPPP